MIKHVSRVLIAYIAMLSIAISAAPLEETRYCGTPKRDAKGQIIRRADVLAAFQRIHPCPATGLKTGACKGWQKNHSIPLACGGCDEVSNLQWLPEKIKVCADDWCVDRFERKINEASVPIAGTATCRNVNVILP